MVKLTKIYTKTGDQGRTMLGDGAMVPKTSARVEAYGAVDEANAALGVAASHVPADGPLAFLGPLLQAAQNDLFDVGADLCAPVTPGEKRGERLRITPGHALRLERLIDEHNEGLGELNSFVLPGGTPLAASLHQARTAVRRAERRVAALIEVEPGATNAEVMVALNRLSDLLFVLARRANAEAAGDILWKPGGDRAGAGA